MPDSYLLSVLATLPSQLGRKVCRKEKPCTEHLAKHCSRSPTSLSGFLEFASLVQRGRLPALAIRSVRGEDGSQLT